MSNDNDKEGDEAGRNDFVEINLNEPESSTPALGRGLTPLIIPPIPLISPPERKESLPVPEQQSGNLSPFGRTGSFPTPARQDSDPYFSAVSTAPPSPSLFGSQVNLLLHDSSGQSPVITNARRSQGRKIYEKNPWVMMAFYIQEIVRGASTTGASVVPAVIGAENLQELMRKNPNFTRNYGVIAALATSGAMAKWGYDHGKPAAKLAGATDKQAKIAGLITGGAVGVIAVASLAYALKSPENAGPFFAAATLLATAALLREGGYESLRGRGFKMGTVSSDLDGNRTVSDIPNTPRKEAGVNFNYLLLSLVIKGSWMVSELKKHTLEDPSSLLQAGAKVLSVLALAHAVSTIVREAFDEANPHFVNQMLNTFGKGPKDPLAFEGFKLGRDGSFDVERFLLRWRDRYVSNALFVLPVIALLAEEKITPLQAVLIGAGFADVAARFVRNELRVLKAEGEKLPPTTVAPPDEIELNAFEANALTVAQTMEALQQGTMPRQPRDSFLALYGDENTPNIPVAMLPLEGSAHRDEPPRRTPSRTPTGGTPTGDSSSGANLPGAGPYPGTFQNNPQVYRMAMPDYSNVHAQILQEHRFRQILKPAQQAPTSAIPTNLPVLPFPRAKECVVDKFPITNIASSTSTLKSVNAIRATAAQLFNKDNPRSDEEIKAHCRANKIELVPTPAAPRPKGLVMAESAGGTLFCSFPRTDGKQEVFTILASERPANMAVVIGQVLPKDFKVTAKQQQGTETGKQAPIIGEPASKTDNGQPNSPKRKQ